MSSDAPPNRIRELRKARGLTLADLAEMAGTTNQQISHLELGKRQLTVDWLRRLAEVFECHPWAIVEDFSSNGSGREAGNSGRQQTAR